MVFHTTPAGAQEPTVAAPEAALATCRRIAVAMSCEVVNIGRIEGTDRMLVGDARIRIDYALSIGPHCRAKYQLRHRFGAIAVGGVFDWQITPLDTVLRYVNCDFRGLFELRDLELRRGRVWNREVGTSHQHEFPHGMETDTELKAAYDRARSRHDHVCQTTRATLRSGRPVLLAFSRLVDDEARQQVIAAFRHYAGGGGHNLHFVFEPVKVPATADWRGDPTVWKALLQPYSASPARRVVMEWHRLAADRRPPLRRRVAEQVG